MCLSQGLPLPNITWWHLRNHTEYTVITTVSKDAINSTFSLTVNDQSSPAVDCISSNRNGEIKETLITTYTSTQEGEYFKNKEKILLQNYHLQHYHLPRPMIYIYIYIFYKTYIYILFLFPEIIDPLFGSISWPEVLIAFTIGVIVSAVICCLLTRLM